MAIDTIEVSSPRKHGIIKLASDYKITYPIMTAYGTRLEPENHQRGSKRIDFILYTHNILTFISVYGITPYGMVSQTNYRDFFVDIDI